MVATRHDNVTERQHARTVRPRNRCRVGQDLSSVRDKCELLLTNIFVLPPQIDSLLPLQPPRVPAQSALLARPVSALR